MESKSSSGVKENSLFVFPLVLLTRLCLRFPTPVLLLSLGLCVASLTIAYQSLHFKTSRLDLINQDSQFNKLWLDYIEEFGDRDDVVIVVEGESAEQLKPVLDDLGAEIRKQPQLFDSVLDSIDTTPLLRKGLYFVEKKGELREIQAFVSQNQGMLAGNWNGLSLDSYLFSLTQQLAGTARLAEPDAQKNLTLLLQQFRPLVAAMLEAVSPQPEFSVNPLPPVDAPGFVKREYLLADEGRLAVVLLKIRESKENSFTYGTQSIDELRKIVRACRERHPDTRIGLTGLTVMENDEMRISQDASTKAGILSFLGVTIIFIAAFGGFRHPIIAVIALANGIIWTLGYITLVVGHLNILSMSFGVILIGLGIDFGIHYIARYLELRKTIADPDRAVLETVASVGPGILVGAMTTAAAFFAIGLSEFTGIAELGLVSTGGVLLCVASAFLVIPSFIKLTDGRQPNRSLPEPIHLHSAVSAIFHFPKTVLIPTFLALIWFSGGLSKLWYDHNLLNMQPTGLESVDLEMILLTKWDKGAWFALSVVDSREELLERKREFEKDPTLKVDEIISRLPETTLAKREIIGEIAASLRSIPKEPGAIPVPDASRLATAVSQLRHAFEVVARSSDPDSGVVDIMLALDEIGRQIRALPESELTRRVSIFQHRLAGAVLERLNLIRFTSQSDPPGLNDLPESLVSRYVGEKSGRLLMRIYSTSEIWNMDHLKDFVAKVKKVDPNATGNPIQTYEASLQMQRSYRQSAIGAFIAICVLILIDFRSIGYTLLVLAPLGLGTLIGLELMGGLGIPFNPANTIVIPLVLGIGVDDGVHLVHNYRLQQGKYRMPPSLASSIIITTLTSIIGFGCLMVSDHRGLESLGRVLVIGISACTFAALIVMPAIFTLMNPANSDEPSD